MPPKATNSGRRVLAAGMILMLALGSVHAFSVFLEPLESEFSVERSTASLTYSLALVFLTISVLFGYRIYGLFKPAVLMIFVCLLAALGCLIAAFATGMPLVWLGYSLLFGSANGLGYGFALQSSAQANPQSKGLAMGLITACYALAAVLSPVLFKVLLDRGGFAAAMTGLAVILAVIAPFIAGLFASADVEFVFSGEVSDKAEATDFAQIVKLWVGYGAAVAAGLMAIGHAAGIARASGLSDAMVLAAPIAIAALNMAGSLLGGWFADRGTIFQNLMIFPAISSLAMAVLALWSGSFVVLPGLAVIGFCYGAIIAIYPVVVGSLFGPLESVRIYGRIFTAWGTAGLLAPVFAGYLYQQFGDYRVALTTAAFAGIVSIASVWSLRGPDAGS